MVKIEITTMAESQGVILPNRIPHTITNQSDNPLKVYRTVGEPNGTTVSVEIGIIRPGKLLIF